MASDDLAAAGQPRGFRTTLWTVVLTAKDPQSPHRRDSLDYWLKWLENK